MDFFFLIQFELTASLPDVAKLRCSIIIFVLNFSNLMSLDLVLLDCVLCTARLLLYLFFCVARFLDFRGLFATLCVSLVTLLLLFDLEICFFIGVARVAIGVRDSVLRGMVLERIILKLTQSKNSEKSLSV